MKGFIEYEDGSLAYDSEHDGVWFRPEGEDIPVMFISRQTILAAVKILPQQRTKGQDDEG
jgi:hypothetical protein